jgi:nitrogen fixation/metabolism regulation signal transduction histidine kinase
MELGSSLGKEKFLSAADKGNFIESKLKRSSKIFKTDINFYDPSGFLVATSRPRVFNSGLLGEQMNPESMTAFKIGNKSSFSHTEKIGKLSFVSSYLPFYSTNGFLLGYLNLQQFGQQQESEQQLQQFLLSIIHIFLVLLAISIIIALFISNWLTSPLRMLQRNFASVRLGQTNQRIVYLQEDEIGALVKNYNKKLDELEEAARQLTISERESAWRDVAKQVAHEIKNPLTPMKLSVQHLLRTFNPEKEDSKERLIRVLESLIEQIDALSHIADEFSNFAKMPPPDFAEMDLLPVIQNVMAIYQQETNAKIELETDLKETHVLADREQMVRVFNNLIKNAIQAIPSDKNGEIRIRIDAEKENYKIRISDNGIGMEHSQLNRIFVPYFTTKSNGSGLGLAMVKQIIENHNGTITAESAIGTGSSFHLLIPQKNRTTS